MLSKDFEICCACDGLDALRTLKKLDKPPDLILSGKDSIYLTILINDTSLTYYYLPLFRCYDA